MRPSIVVVAVASISIGLACGDQPTVVETGPHWVLTGAMNEYRMGHSAVVLPSGSVLVTGGFDSFPVSGFTTGGPGWDAISSAEIYDPERGTWTLTGAMHSPRAAHASFVISSGPYAGMVLIAGGCAGFLLPGDGWVHCKALRATELYDPGTGAWIPGPEMLGPTGFGSIVELSNGELLAVGTSPEPDHTPPGGVSQRLDPRWPEASWRWSGKMNAPRTSASVALLSSGKVLAVGGIRNWTSFDGLNDYFMSVDGETYDPLSETWAMAARAPNFRLWEVFVRLADGRVLRAAGCPDAAWDCEGFPPTAAAWLYDPSQGAWHSTGLMHAPHVFASAVVLDDGQVLVAGGNWKKRNAGGGLDLYPSPRAELLDPVTETWSVTGLMPHYVMGYGAMVKLRSGAALYMGGYVNSSGGTNNVAIKSAQVFR